MAACPLALGLFLNSKSQANKTEQNKSLWTTFCICLRFNLLRCFQIPMGTRITRYSVMNGRACTWKYFHFYYVPSPLSPSYENLSWEVTTCLKEQTTTIQCAHCCLRGTHTKAGIRSGQQRVALRGKVTFGRMDKSPCALWARTKDYGGPDPDAHTNSHCVMPSIKTYLQKLNRKNTHKTFSTEPGLWKVFKLCVVHMTRRKIVVCVLEIKGETSRGGDQIIPLAFTHLSLSSIHHTIGHS